MRKPGVPHLCPSLLQAARRPGLDICSVSSVPLGRVGAGAWAGSCLVQGLVSASVLPGVLLASPQLIVHGQLRMQTLEPDRVSIEL